jgi:hypothetical protein
LSTQPCTYFVLPERGSISGIDTKIVVVEDHQPEDILEGIRINVPIPRIQHITNSRVRVIILIIGREGWMPTYHEGQIMAFTVNLQSWVPQVNGIKRGVTYAFLKRPQGTSHSQNLRSSIAWRYLGICDCGLDSGQSTVKLLVELLLLLLKVVKLFQEGSYAGLNSEVQCCIFNAFAANISGFYRKKNCLSLLTYFPQDMHTVFCCLDNRVSNDIREVP